MEKNLLFKEVHDLEFFNYAYLPLVAFSDALKPSSMLAKMPPKSTNGYTHYVAINLGFTHQDDKKYTYSACLVKDEVTKKCKKSQKKVAYIDDFPENLTAIYIPPHFSPATKTDLILYLHGHLTDTPGLNKQNGKKYSPSIKNYLEYSAKPYFKFRDIVKDSGKNIVFVAPTLGPKSQYGNLATNFDDFMVQVISEINAYITKQLSFKEPIILGKLIIAAHSGGGAAMLEVARQSKSKYAQLIKEFWGFDSWYNSKNAWNEIAGNTSAKVFAYWSDSVQLPKAIKNRVMITAAKNLNHFTLLPYYFRERVNG